MPLVAQGRKRSIADRNASLSATRQRAAARQSERDITRRAESAGTRDYDEGLVTGLNDARAKASAAGQNPYSGQLRNYQSYAANNPTVITDATIREKVGPQIQQDTAMALAKADQGNMQLQQETQAKDQKAAEAAKNKDPMESLFAEKESAIDPYAQAQLDLIDRAMKSKDSSTRLLADRYKTIYDRQRAQQNEVSAKEQGSAGMALQRLGGRYTPGAAGQVQAQIQRQNLEKLAEIDDAEMSAVEELRLAQENKDLQLQGQKLEVLKGIRNERIAQLEAIRKAEADNRKEIEKIVLSAAEGGAPAAVRAQMSAADSVGEAMELAGDYLQKASGTPGEYLFYKREAQAAGQVPLSYQEYADMDANRKRSVVNVGVGGAGSALYSPAQEKVITRIDSSIANNATYKKVTSMNAYADNVNIALDQKNGLSDIAAINQFQKVIDEGAVTRDQDVKLIQGAQSLASSLQAKVKKLEKGEQLTAEQRAQMKRVVSEMQAASKKALENDPFVKSKAMELERQGIDPGDTILGGVISQGSTGGDIIQSEVQAEAAVREYGTSNPQARELINSMAGVIQPDLGRAYTWAEIKEIIGA